MKTRYFGTTTATSDEPTWPRASLVAMSATLVGGWRTPAL
jgi:hypothetical protein